MLLSHFTTVDPLVQSSLLDVSQAGEAVASAAPQPSNTGAHFTNNLSQAALSSQVPISDPPGAVDAIGFGDWVGVVFPVNDDFSPLGLAKSLIEDLVKCDATERAYGRFKYTHGFDLSIGGFILYSPLDPSQGVFLSLPGKSLAQLPTDMLTFLQDCIFLGGRFNRFDAAMDSFTVPIETIFAAFRLGHAVKHGDGKHNQIIEDFADDENHIPRSKGFTLYLGSRSSDSFVRIYDKAAQQKLEDGSIWTRCEVEFKRERAHAAVLAIVAGADPAQVIASAVEFKNRQADSCVTRCPRLDWWAAWLGQLTAWRFAAAEKVAKTVERAMEWVTKQVAPTLAFLDKWKRAQGDSHWLFRLCDYNVYRIHPQLAALLAVEGG